ncbi:conserved protein of unknown function [Rhodovastum atsumiense]|uniref:Uncharacterized protein n=1 Tax=Rhodovastum atsumiense TaxID=504468 RepID=A0A5M6IYL8_9PROT|nr:hypothetical protein [Rhodovastum atsumiense]KAA5613412.1 hypothetical protein F1189_04970 [Rhodovastum atsumiense]CAH2603137.1 conserved protein of unknown function [Rhodovastum atsumiense]
MRRRRWFPVLALGALLMAGVTGYGWFWLDNRCGAPAITALLARKLRQPGQEAGVVIAEQRLATGQFWKNPYRCEAAFVFYRVTASLPQTAWQHITYRVNSFAEVLGVDLVED